MTHLRPTSTYLICYDVSDDRRLRRVFRICRSFGDHLQFSVFRAELSERGRAHLIAKLDEAIDHHADQVLIVDVGPSDGRARESFQALGIPYTHPERHAIVV